MKERQRSHVRADPTSPSAPGIGTATSGRSARMSSPARNGRVAKSARPRPRTTRTHKPGGSRGGGAAEGLEEACRAMASCSASLRRRRASRQPRSRQPRGRRPSITLSISANEHTHGRARVHVEFWKRGDGSVSCGGEARGEPRTAPASWLPEPSVQTSSMGEAGPAPADRQRARSTPRPDRLYRADGSFWRYSHALRPARSRCGSLSELQCSHPGSDAQWSPRHAARQVRRSAPPSRRPSP